MKSWIRAATSNISDAASYNKANGLISPEKKIKEIQTQQQLKKRNKKKNRSTDKNNMKNTLRFRSFILYSSFKISFYRSSNRNTITIIERQRQHKTKN